MKRHKIAVLIGWTGSFLLAICSAPEVYYAFKNEHVKGLSWAFLLLWFFGEIFVGIPVFLYVRERFLLFNYSLNVLLLSILITIKYLGG